MGKSNSKLINQLFDFKGAPLLAVGVLALFYLEKRYALRKRKDSLRERLKTNSMVSSTAIVALRLSLIPALVKAAFLAGERNLGLLRVLRLPSPFNHIISFLLLDYGSYRWHKLNHRMPFLWRFHQVHHADLDLDVTTALRFHFGEVLISVLYRGGWALLAGVTPRQVLVYELIFEGATNFHHTNLRLPRHIDRGLARLIVTPRMHGIHHSVVRDETDSNYSVILNIWDRLHQSLRLDIPQDQINTGVPYIRHHANASELMVMPLQPKAEWKFPDGQVPLRL
ncbi:sterol desaturase family protein [Telluribacter sp.]|jgi:sterol desaturase/sphingolipid hydroxylase (fatty acid hydroxylase superfamily)|uniref:sterol desaturase family protein n=1 Tax=Telluribacter sp. TaxID=1978767 RepID=UPI002E115323|nr:sterol desaturase family protein [Telluribacter sp.]